MSHCAGPVFLPPVLLLAVSHTNFDGTFVLTLIGTEINQKTRLKNVIVALIFGGGKRVDTADRSLC